ncbi:MAG TPA: phosphopantothenoylcysteine decarboxylase [Clostridia bacterium]|nr:phosphopantothenoylcysteine decarboxylase [Clostridia bacterium]
MANILLGVTGSIAAYKAADIANQLTKRGHAVDVVLTKHALEFITPLTFQTLTKRRVYTDLFSLEIPNEVEHISLAKRADIALVAPASANLIGKLANGIADDLLTTVLMALDHTLLYLSPAMNTAMYENRIVQANLKRLTDAGVRLIEPRESVLACGDLGRGALAEVGAILAVIDEALNAPKKE